MALSKNTKIALWGCGSLLFVSIGLVVLFVVVIAVNKDDIMNGAQKSTESGKKFGESHTQAECLNEGLRQNGACSGILCETGVNIFVTACLRAAPEDATTCAGLPEPTSFLQAAAWAKDRCAEVGRPNNQSCMRFMQTRIQECAKNHGAH